MAHELRTVTPAVERIAMKKFIRRRTGAAPITVDGVTFFCWHDGILTYRWRSADERATCGRHIHRSTYYAGVDGNIVGDRFRSLRGAMKAAVKAMKGSH